MSHDAVIIGAGPAGYVAAIRCAQLGLRTACIDDWLGADGKPALGGTCLNAGCIPSKALLDSSELYHRAQHEFSGHGILASGIGLDLAAMQARKGRIVGRLTGGIAGLFRAHGIDWRQGRGRLLDGMRVEYTSHGGKSEILEAGHIILAAGSRPIELEAAPVDQERIVDSAGALAFDEVPKRLAIIGAGVIGLELGSVWNRLGAEVVLLEAQEEFLPAADRQLARLAQQEYARQGLDIRLGARVVSTHAARRQVAVCYKHGEEEQEVKAEKLVVAVGRRPNSEGLAAAEADLLLDERGFVHVDEYCATNLPGVYAIGDLVRGPMLAHKGSEEGIAVAEHIAGGPPLAVNHDIMPSVVYTHPELAWVGATEQELKGRGIPFRAGTFPFAATGRAQAMEAATGMVKLLADAETDRLLGAHVFGPCASELIAEAVVALEHAAASEDLARTIHAHPTLSEAVHEAALAVDGRAIHQKK